MYGIITCDYFNIRMNATMRASSRSFSFYIFVNLTRQNQRYSNCLLSFLILFRKLDQWCTQVCNRQCGNSSLVVITCVSGRLRKAVDLPLLDMVAAWWTLIIIQARRRGKNCMKGKIQRDRRAVVWIFYLLHVRSIFTFYDCWTRGGASSRSEFIEWKFPNRLSWMVLSQYEKQYVYTARKRWGQWKKA